MKKKLLTLMWLCLGSAATAIAVPLIAALGTSRPIAPIVRNATWLGLMIAAGVAIVILLSLRDRARASRQQIAAPRRDAALAEADPVSRVLLASPWSADSRRHSLSFIVGCALTLGSAPIEVLSGDRVPERSPAHQSRTVVATRHSTPGQSLSSLVLEERSTDAGQPNNSTLLALMIDADRNGEYVLFDHRGHQQTYGEHKSCVKCHHASIGPDRATPCFECHADMLLETDVFSHIVHIESLGGQTSCDNCHAGGSETRAAASAKPCRGCHAGFHSTAIDSADDSPHNLAPGFAQALHGSCVGCHDEEGLQAVDNHGIPESCAPCHPPSRHKRLRESASWEALKSVQILRANAREVGGEQRDG